MTELVEASSRHIDEILKEVNALIAVETNAKRKEQLNHIRFTALKEQANFRLLARHVRVATPKNILNVSEVDDAFDNRDGSHWRKEFRGLPEQLGAKLARELPVRASIRLRA